MSSRSDGKHPNAPKYSMKCPGCDFSARGPTDLSKHYKSSKGCLQVRNRLRRRARNRLQKETRSNKRAIVLGEIPMVESTRRSNHGEIRFCGGCGSRKKPEWSYCGYCGNKL